MFKYREPLSRHALNRQRTVIPHSLNPNNFAFLREWATQEVIDILGEDYFAHLIISGGSGSGIQWVGWSLIIDPCGMLWNFLSLLS